MQAGFCSASGLLCYILSAVMVFCFGWQGASAEVPRRTITPAGHLAIAAGDKHGD